MWRTIQEALQLAESAAHMSYESAITIILTALGVILAALGVIFTLVSVVLAFLAIVGYRDLISHAEHKMEEILSRYPSPEVLQAQVKTQVNQLYANLTAVPAQEQIDVAAIEAAASDAVESSGEQTQVSAPYPTSEEKK